MSLRVVRKCQCRTQVNDNRVRRLVSHQVQHGLAEQRSIGKEDAHQAKQEVDQAGRQRQW